MPGPEYEEPDFANGYHEAWEVHLHFRRAKARASGEQLSRADENTIVDDFIRKNRKAATKPVLCPTCSREIKIALAEGRSPWSIPDSFRMELKSFTVRTIRGCK